MLAVTLTLRSPFLSTHLFTMFFFEEYFQYALFFHTWFGCQFPYSADFRSINSGKETVC